MISNLNELNKHEITKVKKEYENKTSVTEIAKKYKLDRNVVLAILGEIIDKKELAAAYINEDKFIIISDTHIGSELEKIRYLNNVYEYASKYGIKTILHAGDLMQSTLTPVQRKYVNVEKQLEYLIKEYPYDGNIRNHILFGNHDYHTLAKNDKYLKVLNSRSDFHLLGFKRAYVNWKDLLLSIYHPIDKYKINIPNFNPFLNIYGHTHAMHVKNENGISVPTLSLDTKKHPNGLSLPGFLVVEKNGDTMNVYHYVFREYLYDSKDRLETLMMREKDTKWEKLGIVLSRKLGDNKKK